MKSINFDGQSDYIEVDEKDWMFPKGFTFTIDFKFNTLEELYKNLENFKHLGDK